MSSLRGYFAAARTDLGEAVYSLSDLIVALTAAGDTLSDLIVALTAAGDTEGADDIRVAAQALTLLRDALDVFAQDNAVVRPLRPGDSL